MLEDKTPIYEAIESILNNTRCIPLKKKIYDVYQCLGEGSSIFSAFQRGFSPIISSYDLRSIQSAELHGSLGSLFLSMANFIDQKTKFFIVASSKIYFLLGILCLCVLASHSIAVHFIPYLKLDGYLNNFNLTPVMRSYDLFFGGDFFKLFLMFGVFLCCIPFFHFVLKKFLFYKKLLSFAEFTVPYISRMVRARELSNFCFSFSAGLEAKLPFQSAFSLASSSVINQYYKKEIEALNRLLQDGYSLETALQTSKLFLADESHLLNNALKGSRLSEAARSMREYAQMKLSSYVQLLVTVLQIIFLLGIVGIITFGLIFGADVYVTTMLR